MPPLKFEDIAARLQGRLGALFLESHADGHLPYVKVDARGIGGAARYLRDDADLACDFLSFITAVDWPADEKITLVYCFASYKHRHTVVVKADVSRAAGRAPSLTNLYAAADWLEREVYDLFGVAFDGHPDLRRIMLPDDFQGHPLLKDFANDDYIPFPESKIG